MILTREKGLQLAPLILVRPHFYEVILGQFLKVLKKYLGPNIGPIGTYWSVFMIPIPRFDPVAACPGASGGLVDAFFSKMANF